MIIDIALGTIIIIKEGIEHSYISVLFGSNFLLLSILTLALNFMIIKILRNIASFREELN